MNSFINTSTYRYSAHTHTYAIYNSDKSLIHNNNNDAGAYIVSNIELGCFLALRKLQRHNRDHRP